VGSSDNKGILSLLAIKGPSSIDFQEVSAGRILTLSVGK